MAMPGMSTGVSGVATDDLGLGGQLDQQVKNETDDERRKRLAQMQQAKFGLPDQTSLASLSLFGGRGGTGAGY